MFLSSVFRPFNINYRPVSIYDELDNLFPFYSSHHPHYLRWNPLERAPQPPKHWTTTINLEGFRPEEVSTKLDDTENSRKVLIHAQHQDGDDYSEVRRSIEIPEEVNKEKLQVYLTKEGHLLIKAPLKQDKLRQMAAEANEGIWGEMNRLHQRIDNIFDCDGSSIPKTEIVSSEDGGEKFRVNFSVTGYKPEEVSVHQKGNSVIVEARQEQNSNEHSSLKRMRREVAIPIGVHVDGLTSQLGEDGVLCLEAPYVRPQQPALESRKIPINVLNGADTVSSINGK